MISFFIHWPPLTLYPRSIPGTKFVLDFVLDYRWIDWTIAKDSRPKIGRRVMQM